MERGKQVLEPANGSEENWLQEVSQSPSPDCLNPSVKQQYGEALEIPQLLPRTAEPNINCCLWSASGALDRRREGNASIILLTPVPGRVLGTASHLTESPLGNNSSGGCSGGSTARRDGEGAVPGRWHGVGHGKGNQVSARVKTPGCPHPASGGSFNAGLAGEGVKTAQLRA